VDEEGMLELRRSLELRVTMVFARDEEEQGEGFGLR